MKKLLSFLLIFFLTSCETVSDFSMPNLGMPDLAKYNINPFSRNAAQEIACPKPMILADAISMLAPKTDRKQRDIEDDCNKIMD